MDINKDIFFTRNGLLDRLLNNTFDQAIIVDKNANIIFFSESSERFSKRKSEHMIGKPIKEFIPDHGFNKVILSGVADKGVLVNLDGNISIVNHIPVIDDDEVIGAIGIVAFSSLDSVKKLLSSLASSGNPECTTLYDSVSRHSSRYSFKDYIGESYFTKQLIEQAQIAAESDLPILITGETGTGKEIIANAIHLNNKNTILNPFIKINCSAIPNHLLESEMFGYEKGAFTGASATKKGKFELADNGSILLDEIGDMDILLQTKLLRVLEEKEFERVGGNRLIPTNARMIASTNTDLPKLCEDKKFREDLYYRLNTLELYMHPLRDRISDIPLLINHFISNSQYDIRFDNDALDMMMSYYWPGNVRQLRNMVNRFGVLKKGHIVSGKDVKEALHLSFTGQKAPLPDTIGSQPPIGHGSLKEVEKVAIENVLKESKNNQTLAAQRLHISRSTLIRKIKIYKIDI